MTRKIGELNHPSKTINEQATRWFRQNSIELSIAFCLRWTDVAIRERKIHDSATASKDLRRFLNKLDRRIFGAKNRYGGKRLKRLIVLEQTSGSSWHVHGLIETIELSDEEAFVEIFENLWREHIEAGDDEVFELRMGRRYGDYDQHEQKHLVWIQDKSGGYERYMTKYLGNDLWRELATANLTSKGALATVALLDVDNISLT
jgi:hypothetical protein